MRIATRLEWRARAADAATGLPRETLVKWLVAAHYFVVRCSESSMYQSVHSGSCAPHASYCIRLAHLLSASLDLLDGTLGQQCRDGIALKRDFGAATDL